MNDQEKLARLFRIANGVGEGLLDFCQMIKDAGGDLRDDAELVRTFAKLQKMMSCTADTNGAVFRRLRAAVRDGTARREFPIGMIIQDVWTDMTVTRRKNYVLWRIVDYCDVELANGHILPGAILLRVSVPPFRVKFGVGSGYDASIVHRDLHQQFINGCSDELVRMVAEVRLYTKRHDGEIEKTRARFFLPLMENLHLIPPQDGEVLSQSERGSLAWEYFRDVPSDGVQPCAKLAWRDQSGEPVDCWMRNASPGATNVVWALRKDGVCTVMATQAELHYAPACVIV